MAALAVSLSGVASAATPTKTNRTFKTADGHYLTAVNSGGLTGLGQQPFDVMHTDAVRAGSWETFTLVDAGDGTLTAFKPLTGITSPPSVVTDGPPTSSIPMRRWQRPGEVPHPLRQIKPHAAVPRGRSLGPQAWSGIDPGLACGRASTPLTISRWCLFNGGTARSPVPCAVPVGVVRKALAHSAVSFRCPNDANCRRLGTHEP